MGPGMPSVLGPPMPPPRRAGAVIMPGGPMPAAGLVLVPAPGNILFLVAITFASILEKTLK